MASCPRCGTPAAYGAVFCPNCGASLTPAAAPLGAAERSTRLAEQLILAGAIAGGILFGIVAALLALVSMMAGAFGGLFTGGPEDLLFFPLLVVMPMFAVMLFLAIIILLLGVGWVVGALAARRRIARGHIGSGSTIAIVLGALLCLLGISTFLPLIPGGLVLAGGILARSRA